MRRLLMSEPSPRRGALPPPKDQPPGFAAVVLIDESHVSAHCYSESGLLAIDIFTCGDSDPGSLADKIHSVVVDAVPSLVLSGRGRLDRF